MAMQISVEELSPGDHACLVYSDREERLDIVSAFVRSGIDQRQKVACLAEALAPDRLAAELTERGVPVAGPRRWGQLLHQASDESWLAGGGFKASWMVDFLAQQVDLARRMGFAGLRLTADMAGRRDR